MSPSGRPRTCGPCFGTAPVARCRPGPVYTNTCPSTAGWVLAAGGRSPVRRAPAPQQPCGPCPSHPPTRAAPAWTGPCPCPAGRTGRRPRRRTSTLHWAPWGRRPPGKRCIVLIGPGAGGAARAGRDRRQLGALRPHESVRGSQRLPDQHRRRRALRDDIGRREQAPDQSRPLQVSAIDERIGPPHRLPQWRGHHRRQSGGRRRAGDFAWLSPAAPLRPRRVANRPRPARPD